MMREYKTGIHSNFNGKDFKPKRKNAAAVHNDAELCSYTSDEAEKLCLHSSSDTCGAHRVDVTDRKVKVLNSLIGTKEMVINAASEMMRNNGMEH